MRYILYIYIYIEDDNDVSEMATSPLNGWVKRKTPERNKLLMPEKRLKNNNESHE